jgi:hypothetical protein
LIGATLPGNGPSQASTEGPWCAIVNEGGGSTREICHFQDIESCRLEVISGNRGFCRRNSYYTGPQNRRPPGRNRYRY